MPEIGSLGSLTVSYEADLTGLEAGSAKAAEAVGKVAASAEKSSGSFREMLGKIGEMVGGMAVFHLMETGVDKLGEAITDFFKVNEEHQQIMVQTEQAIKSTGDASGMTAEQISGMAEEMAKITPFSAEATQSAENLLLTFTNIGQNVFPDATQAMLDMSQAMGQDTKSSAIELGKALNDPLTGMSALQRVGVTFSAAQKEVIKQMMATGDTAGAQKIILQELEKEFGGSAEAAGKTFAGQLAILQHSFESLELMVGTIVMPVLQLFVGAISDIVGFLTSGNPLVWVLAGAIGAVGIAIVGAKIADFAIGLKKAFDEAQAGDGIFQTLAKRISTDVGDAVKEFTEKHLPNLHKAFFDVKDAAEETATAEENVGKVAETTMAEEVATGSAEAETSIASIGTTAEATEATVGTASAGMATALLGNLGLLSAVFIGAQQLQQQLGKLKAPNQGLTVDQTADINRQVGYMGPGLNLFGQGTTQIKQQADTMQKDVTLSFQEMTDNADAALADMKQKGLDASIASFKGFTSEAKNLLTSMGNAGKDILASTDEWTQKYWDNIAGVIDNMKSKIHAFLYSQDMQEFARTHHISAGILNGNFYSDSPTGDTVQPHASGGIIQPGQYGIVGDQGSEMVYGGSSGVSVLSHPQTMAALSTGYSPAMLSGGGSGGNNEYHFHIELGGREIGYTMASDSGFVDAIGTGVVKRIRQLSGGKR